MDKGVKPYSVFENDYWGQGRDVCVVDEINCIDGDNAEIICNTHPKNEEWIRGLASVFGFSVTKQRMEDHNGRYLRFEVRKEVTDESIF